MTLFLLLSNLPLNHQLQQYTVLPNSIIARNNTYGLYIEFKILNKPYHLLSMAKKWAPSLRRPLEIHKTSQ